MTSGGAQMDPKGLAALPPMIKDAYSHAVATGTHQVFLWGAVISISRLRRGLVPQGGPATRRPGHPGRELEERGRSHGPNSGTGDRLIRRTGRWGCT